MCLRWEVTDVAGLVGAVLVLRGESPREEGWKESEDREDREERREREEWAEGEVGVSMGKASLVEKHEEGSGKV